MGREDASLLMVSIKESSGEDDFENESEDNSELLYSDDDEYDNGNNEYEQGEPVVAPLCNRSNLLWITGGTVLLESITCLFRFGFHWESTRTTSSLAKFTGGLRIHHGYLGLLLLLFINCNRDTATSPKFRKWGFCVGWALVASDLIHHFLVLWPLTGNPHFDLVYPHHHS